MKILQFGFILSLLLPFFNYAHGADTCVTASCHRAIAELKYFHMPVKEGDCLSCHKSKGKTHPEKGGSFELVAKGAALCYQCHDPKGKKKVVHPPVKDGDCTSCHHPHGGSARNLLNVGADRTELCLSCHDSALFKQKYQHAPVAAGECGKCHDPHEADLKFLLAGPVREVCLKCHADMVKALKDAPVIHPPVKDGPCTSCHNPHSSPAQSLLKTKMPDLCVGCHDKISKKVGSVKVPHKPILMKGGCANCHSPHFANAKGLLATDEKSVCLSCHGKDNLGTPPLRNISKDIEGKTFVHGPIMKGQCKACHDPHGSDNFRMLRGAYPADFYAPYQDGIYEACLICHEKNMLRFADTTIYTNFRNGNRNLHYLHVVNSRKGRTCRACHEPHASDGPKLTRLKGSDFGTWKIPFQLELTATGGSCSAGCHKALMYDRVKPVKFSQGE